MRSCLGFVLKALSFIVYLLPRQVLRWLGGSIGFLWIDLLGFRKKIILDNLKIAFPDWSDEKRQKVGRASVYHMAYNFAEFFTIPQIDQKFVDRHVVYEGWEHLEAARAQNKGVYLLSLHMGSGDMAANLITMKGLPVWIITKQFKNALLNDLWFSIRGAQGVRYIDAHGRNTAFEILKALKAQGAVAFVLDQFMGKPYGVETEFFGRKTGTAYGLSLFATKTGSPILPVYIYEGDDKKLHVVFEPPVNYAHLLTEDKQANLVAITQEFNNRLEAIVRRHPEQWMWIHRRWKEFE